MHAAARFPYLLLLAKSSLCEAKILHVWDAQLKEADGLALTSPPTETSAEQEHNPNKTSRAAQQSPVHLTAAQVSTQEMLARGMQSPCQEKPGSWRVIKVAFKTEV